MLFAAVLVLMLMLVLVLVLESLNVWYVDTLCCGMWRSGGETSVRGGGWAERAASCAAVAGSCLSACHMRAQTAT